MPEKKTNYKIQLDTIPLSIKKKFNNKLKVDAKNIIPKLALLDIFHIMKVWSYIKGYPTGGQLTYTRVLYNYIDYIVGGSYIFVRYEKRDKIITKWNYFLDVDIYTGKWLIRKQLNKLHTRFKLSPFTKTRKPFFRSKRKRKNKCQKKKLIIKSNYIQYL